MRYKIDHDYHIHSQLSLCSKDPQQTTANILKYAQKNNLKKICLTDHFWDKSVKLFTDMPFYEAQDFDHISNAKPLPKAEGIEFLFGCETDFDKNFTLGLAKENFNKFDFVIIPTTHLHMMNFTIDPENSAPEKRAKLWCERLKSLLNMDLPFHKIGIAHLACGLIAPTRTEYLKTLELIPTEDMQHLFKKAADVKVGIELNHCDMDFADDETDTVLRMFKIAKDAGCKFYLASDSHHPKDFENQIPIMERAIDLLNLTEDDKFHF